MRGASLLVLSLAAAAACSGSDGGVASNTGGAASGGGGSAGSGGAGGSATGGAAGSSGAAGASCTTASKADYSPQILGQSLAQGSLRAAVVVWDPPSERYVVLFGAVNANGGFRTRGMTVRWSGSALEAGPELELADASSPTIDSLERDLVRSEGAQPRVLALLEDTRQTGDVTREVMGQFLKIASDGQVLQDGPSFSVTQLPGQHEYTPSAAWDSGSSAFFVTWSDDREEKAVPDGRLVYGRTLGIDGSLGPEVRLGGSSRWQVGAAVAGSGGKGRFLVAWGDYDLTPNLDAGYRARLVGGTGKPSGAVIDLARYGDHVYDPVTLAWQPCRGAWFVVWMREEKLYGSWVSFDGQVQQNDLLLADHVEGAGAPRLVWIPTTQSFALTFHAWKTENAFLQILDAEGNRVGEPQSINTSMPSLGTFWHPVAARADQPEVLVLPSINYATLTGSVFTSY